MRDSAAGAEALRSGSPFASPQACRHGNSQKAHWGRPFFSLIVFQGAGGGHQPHQLPASVIALRHVELALQLGSDCRASPACRLPAVHLPAVVCSRSSSNPGPDAAHPIDISSLSTCLRVCGLG